MKRYIEIGTKYEQIKLILGEVIREKNCDFFEIELKNHACYFCGKRIEEKMLIIDLEDEKSSSKFYIDKCCHNKIKLLDNYGGKLFSLN